MAKPSIYLTTPIYYVNDQPHIGHAYTTVAADCLARYYRISGQPVFYLTGTDEHGEKIEKAAQTAGETPQELADRVVKRFKTLWELLNISFNDFIRTTEPRHQQGVAKFFEAAYQKGAIYAGEYEGWYCVPDETYWTEGQLLEGKLCPTCGRVTQRLKEASYFFKLSAFQDRLLAHIKAHPDFIQPVSKRNEVVAFIEQGLRDLSISRTSFKWGIPVPSSIDKSQTHVIYVWFDALTNYLTAVGYGDPTKQALFADNWPAALHLVGKDILRFHTIYWPAFLMAVGLPLPKTVFAHGWWTVNGDKMSKSKGNFVDPFEIVEKYGADPFRYFLMREFPFGADGDFSDTAFITRLNSDIANDLGNLVSRSISMVEKYCAGKIPPVDSSDSDLKISAAASIKRYQEKIEKYAFDDALKSVWELLSCANRYIDLQAPWQLAKDPNKKAGLDQVMYNLMESLRIISILIFPYMPTMSNKIRKKLSLTVIGDQQVFNWLAEAKIWGTVQPGTAVQKGESLFQRIV